MRSPVAAGAPLTGRLLAALLALLLAGCGSSGAGSQQALPPSAAVHHRAHHAGWPTPVEMHALGAPAPRGSNRATTYGLGDLDGDGRSDMVQVRTDGLVTSELTWLGHRSVHVRADPTLRVQGLPDLDGDGRAEVLLATTASGCCNGYRLTQTRSLVLVLDHGRLRRLRWASGGPATIRFDEGRGDVWGGIRCEGTTLHLLGATGDGERAQLSDTPVTIAGGLASRGTTVQRTVPPATVRAETRTRCPGLDAQGWAR